MAMVSDAIRSAMPFIMQAQPGFTDAEGTFTPSNDPVLDILCQISQKSRRVVTSSGDIVVSGATVSTGSFNSLTIDGYRYTIPTRPGERLKAIQIIWAPDGDGFNHEQLMFRAR